MFKDTEIQRGKESGHSAQGKGVWRVQGTAHRPERGVEMQKGHKLIPWSQLENNR